MWAGVLTDYASVMKGKTLSPVPNPPEGFTGQGDDEKAPDEARAKQPPPRLPGSAKGKLRVIADDDEHLAGFHGYLP